MKHTKDWYLQREVERQRLLAERRAMRKPKKKRKKKFKKPLVIPLPKVKPMIFLKVDPKASALTTVDFFNKKKEYTYELLSDGD